jgi:hypothetical protein
MNRLNNNNPSYVSPVNSLSQFQIQPSNDIKYYNEMEQPPSYSEIVSPKKSLEEIKY